MNGDVKDSRHRYRPDIDGLRAVAVLSVLLFHVDDTWMPGGFVGVDIFFVISGFLISSILARDITQGRLSFREFYRRRVLRIAPAYLAVTLATLLAGAVLMLPTDFSDLARSALWSAFSLGNVYFWNFLDTSYFAADTKQVPLLHLWSLGVEEQFYLVWPLLLLALYRLFASKWFAVAGATVAVAAASFIAAQAWAASDVGFAYYMLPARAGELLSGALLALALQAGGERVRVPRLLSELFATAGFGLIGYSLYTLDKDSLFPGFNALYPCAGAFLLILAGREASSLVMAPLRWRPVVWVGLVSYSLYLWHWPILALARYFVADFSLSEKVALIVVIFAVSALSYRFIELPFRSAAPSGASGRRRVFPVYVTSTLAVAALCFGIVRFGGFSEAPWNVSARQTSETLVERTKPALRYPYNCQSGNTTRSFASEQCVIRPDGSPRTAPVRVLLAGDSNAAHYIGVIGAIGERYGFAFRNVSVSSCPPVFGKNEYSRRDPAPCSRFRNQLRRRTEGYDVVILGGQWSAYDRNPSFREDMRATIRYLRRNGKQVVILGVVPRFQAYGTQCELRRVRMPLVDCEARSSMGGAVNTRVNRFLEDIAARNKGVSYLDVTEVICPGGACSAYLDGLPVYYDPGHLSMAGSWDVGAKIVSAPALVPDVLKRPIGTGSSP